MNKMKTSLSTFAILAIAVPGFAADFATFDTNADGQISFDEYKLVAVTEGRTETLAAQEFIRMAQGDTIITEDEFFLADALAGQPYALQLAPIAIEAVPMAFEATEVVETLETSLEAKDMFEPPVETEEITEVVPESVTMEKAMDVDPVVAGEIVTSIERTPEIDASNDVTSFEDVKVIEPDLETKIEPARSDVEIDLEVDIETGLEETEDLIESGEIY